MSSIVPTVGPSVARRVSRFTERALAGIDERTDVALTQVESQDL